MEQILVITSSNGTSHVFRLDKTKVMNKTSIAKVSNTNINSA